MQSLQAERFSNSTRGWREEGGTSVERRKNMQGGHQHRRMHGTELVYDNGSMTADDRTLQFLIFMMHLLIDFLVNFGKEQQCATSTSSF